MVISYCNSYDEWYTISTVIFIGRRISFLKAKVLKNFWALMVSIDIYYTILRNCRIMPPFVASFVSWVTYRMYLWKVVIRDVNTSLITTFHKNLVDYSHAIASGDESWFFLVVFFFEPSPNVMLILNRINSFCQVTKTMTIWVIHVMWHDLFFLKTLLEAVQEIIYRKFQSQGKPKVTHEPMSYNYVLNDLVDLELIYDHSNEAHTYVLYEIFSACTVICN